MGLQDRDYMHERRERPFTPSNEQGTPTWLIVLLLALAAYALHQAYERWWLPRHPVLAPVDQKPAPRPAPARTRPSDPSASPSGAPGWSRCEVNGRVLYTDRPCPGGAPSVRAQPASPPQQASTGTTTLYHCKGYDGATFWANSHCNQHRALVDRMVDVPAWLSFDQQVARAEAQRREVLAENRRRQVQASTRVMANPQPDRASLCQMLDERVRHLDAMARQPLSAAEQDRIRAERHEARNRRFRLHC